MLHTCEFCENLDGEGLTFLMGVHEITFGLVP